jgi:hypothetical protein
LASWALIPVHDLRKVVTERAPWYASVVAAGFTGSTSRGDEEIAISRWSLDVRRAKKAG